MNIRIYLLGFNMLLPLGDLHVNCRQCFKKRGSWSVEFLGSLSQYRKARIRMRWVKLNHASARCNSVFTFLTVCSSWIFCTNVFIFIFKIYFIEVQLICNLQVLLYSKVIQLYIYINLLFFIFFSIMVYHEILNIFPRAIQSDLVVYPFCIEWFACTNPKLPIHPSKKFCF